MCEILGVKKQGRRGWANGLCISCARCNRCMEPRKSRNRRHHKKEMPSEKKPKEKKPNHYPKDSVTSRHQDRDNMCEGLRTFENEQEPRDAPKATQMTVKREPEAEEDDARPSNVKVHPYIQLHEHYLIEKRERARCEKKKTKWKRQALRKGRACARLTAAVFKMNDELMKTKQRPAAEITTNDEDPSSNETGNDGPVSDKVDDDDFSMDKKLPKGVRICKGPVPMPRIPVREKCQGRKTLASATQRKRQRTCLSSSGCGKLSCEDCYP